MPRPAPRVAPATTAIFEANGFALRSRGMEEGWDRRLDTFGIADRNDTAPWLSGDLRLAEASALRQWGQRPTQRRRESETSTSIEFPGLRRDSGGDYVRSIRSRSTKPDTASATIDDVPIGIVSVTIRA